MVSPRPRLLCPISLAVSVALAACESTPAKNPTPGGTATPVGSAVSSANTPTAGPGTPTPAGPATDSTRSQTPASAPTSGPAELLALQHESKPIRALYVNRFAAQSTKKMQHLIGIADSTEINGLVIDIKDEFGLNFHSSDSLLKKNEGKMNKVADLKKLVDTIRAHGILPIARIVVFKDSVAARANPEHVIRRPDGEPWHDKKGLTWVNPYANAIWEYNFRVAEEAVRMGFGEIQFDYIRFPEPYKSLPPQVFPEANGRSKQKALADFLTTAHTRIDKLGVRTTADIFGLVTTVRGALEVGQEWEVISPVVDVVLPMTYPSHYPPGSFGIKSPNAAPYDILHIAVSSAQKRDEKIGLKTPEHVRPWLQAFTLGAPHYGPDEIRAQKRGVYDSGYDGWVLWNPGSKYDEILPALEKTFESRKKNPPVPLPAGTHLGD
jgi:hypothetical protein